MPQLKYPKFWSSIGIIPIILLPLSFIYIIGTLIRKFFVKKYIFRFPLICIGNAAVGGTGKTVLVKYLANYYLNKGKKIAISVKGFGGNYINPTIVDSNSDVNLVGDEAVEIASFLKANDNLIIIAAKNPFLAKDRINNFKPDLIISDDGLQNPYFEKTLKILMIDGLRGIGNGLILPSGPMRENYRSTLKKVDFICSLNPSDYVEKLCTANTKTPALFFKTNLALDIDKNSQIFVFSAIGNPERFIDSLKNYTIVGYKHFADHYLYTKEDSDNILKKARICGAKYIVTTAKDYVKIKNYIKTDILKVAYIEITEENIENLTRQIDAKIAN
jgi:tetraacyldisaccharide 4'-kinase